MPISLKAQLGGGGTDPVNSMKLFVSNKKMLDIGPQKWLRSGFVETNTAAYPSAEIKRQFDKIVTINPTPRFSGTFLTTAPISDAPFRFNSVDKSIWVEMCTSSLGAGWYIRYSNDGGTTFQAGLLSSSTSYTWKQVAASGTDAVVIGLSNSSGNAVFTRTNNNFSPLNSEVATTFSSTSDVHVTWNGNKYVFVQGVGQTCANMSSGGTAIVYSGVSGMICTGLYSYHTGVVIAVGTHLSNGTPLVRRSTDNGVSWTTVFTTGQGKIYKHPTLSRLFMFATNNSSSLLTGIYYSDDQGVTWLTATLTGDYVGLTGLNIPAEINGYGALVINSNGIYLPFKVASGSGGTLAAAWVAKNDGTEWEITHPTRLVTTSGADAGNMTANLQRQAPINLQNFTCVLASVDVPASTEYGTPSKVFNWPTSTSFVGSSVTYTEGDFSDIQAYYVRIF